MITIQEHLNKSNPDKFFNNLALSHWNELNPKLKNQNKYKATSLIKKCEKYYSECLTEKYIQNYADGSITKSKRHKKLFIHLKRNNYQLLKKIILAKPNEFNDINNKIFKIIKPGDVYCTNANNLIQTKFGKLITTKFLNYAKFRSSKYCVKLYSSLKFINLTCPYCNDKEVEIVKKNPVKTLNKNNILYFDIDHFYPKSKYPFFALSFFNLIPVCKICNSIEKRTLDFNVDTHIHPYHEAFDDFYKFKISLKVLLGDSIDELVFEEIKFKNNDKTIKDLNLNNRYFNRLVETQELVRYYMKHYKRYNSASDLQTFKEIFFNVKGVPKQRNKILYKKNGKLFRDILKQIDIIDLLNIT